MTSVIRDKRASTGWAAAVARETNGFRRMAQDRRYWLIFVLSRRRTRLFCSLHEILLHSSNYMKYLVSMYLSMVNVTRSIREREVQYVDSQVCVPFVALYLLVVFSRLPASRRESEGAYNNVQTRFFFASFEFVFCALTLTNSACFDSPNSEGAPCVYMHELSCVCSFYTVAIHGCM